MPRLASGEEKPPMSAEARRWCVEPMVLRALGGRRELEPSGVLFRLPAMLDMMAVVGACVAEI